MPRWVSLPVVRRAVRFTGFTDEGNPIFDCFDEGLPTWLAKAMAKRVIYPLRDRLYVHTLEGQLMVNTYDYIVCGTRGEISPWSPEEFESSHRRAA